MKKTLGVTEFLWRYKSQVSRRGWSGAKRAPKKGSRIVILDEGEQITKEGEIVMLESQEMRG